MLSVYKPEAEHHCKCVHACVYLYVFVYISAVAGVCVCLFVSQSCWYRILHHANLVEENKDVLQTLFV